MRDSSAQGKDLGGHGGGSVQPQRPSFPDTLRRADRPRQIDDIDDILTSLRGGHELSPDHIKRIGDLETELATLDGIRTDDRSPIPSEQRLRDIEERLGKIDGIEIQSGIQRNPVGQLKFLEDRFARALERTNTEQAKPSQPGGSLQRARCITSTFTPEEIKRIGEMEKALTRLDGKETGHHSLVPPEQGLSDIEGGLQPFNRSHQGNLVLRIGPPSIGAHIEQPGIPNPVAAGLTLEDMKRIAKLEKLLDEIDGGTTEDRGKVPADQRLHELEARLDGVLGTQFKFPLQRSPRGSLADIERRAHDLPIPVRVA